MTKLVLTLHVLAAVFLIGPMAIAPMIGMRAIRRHDARGAHEAARTTTLYTLLSLIVAALGFILIAVNSKRWAFGDVWVVISITLYVIALVLSIGVVAPGLTAAARLLDVSTTPTPATPLTPQTSEAPTEAVTPEPAGTDTATIDVDARRKVDAAYGRVAASGGVTALLLVLVTILMVTRPGG